MEHIEIVLNIILVIVIRYIICTFCCSDIDDCTPDLCTNGTTCVDGVDSFN